MHVFYLVQYKFCPMYVIRWSIKRMEKTNLCYTNDNKQVNLYTIYAYRVTITVSKVVNIHANSYINYFNYL